MDGYVIVSIETLPGRMSDLEQNGGQMQRYRM